MQEQVHELVAERPGVLLGLEIAVGLAPAIDGVGNARDHRAHGVFALGRAQRAAEVLLDDHVGGGLRPRLGELDAALFEEDLAVGAANHGIAPLPLDGFERVLTGAAIGGEVPLDSESRALVFDDPALDSFSLNSASLVGWSDGDGLHDHDASRCSATLIENMVSGSTDQLSRRKGSLLACILFGLLRIGSACIRTGMSESKERASSLTVCAVVSWRSEPEGTCIRCL